jgi:acyl-CoA thioester hydrolase
MQPSPTASTQPFRYMMRVRYGECDAQRVVFNARYGEYVDLACMEFFRTALPADLDPLGGGFEIMLVKQVTEWKGSCRFDDILEITTAVKEMGNTSFTLRFDIRVAGDPALRVSCETVYVHVVEGADHTFTKAPIPERARAALLAGARGHCVDQSGAARSPTT